MGVSSGMFTCNASAILNALSERVCIAWRILHHLVGDFGETKHDAQFCINVRIFAPVVFSYMSVALAHLRETC